MRHKLSSNSWFVIVGALVVALAGQSFCAAARIRQGWPQLAKGDPVTLTYSYNNMLDGGLLDPSGTPLPVEYVKGAIEEALGLWASVAPLNFVEVEDEGGPVIIGAYPDGQYGQLRFHHLYMDGPDPAACAVEGADPDACGAKPKARAYFPSTTNQAGDVYFDHGDRWLIDGTLYNPDVLGAAIHEIGHTLGLDHPLTDQPQHCVDCLVDKPNLWWVFTRYDGLGDGMLHIDDITGIQQIYGAGVGSVTPLGSVPEPASLSLLLLAALGALAVRRR